MRNRSRLGAMVRTVWTHVKCGNETHRVGLRPWGRAIIPHTSQEIRASRALAFLGGESLGCMKALECLEQGDVPGPREWRELVRQVRIERNSRHREVGSTVLWPHISDRDLLTERRVVRALMKCGYDYKDVAPECIHYRSTVSLGSAPGVRVVECRAKDGPGLSVYAVVGPRWLEVERLGLAVVDGSLVLRMARRDAGYDVVAARQLQGLDIQPWPASLVGTPGGGWRLEWRVRAWPAPRGAFGFAEN